MDYKELFAIDKGDKKVGHLLTKGLQFLNKNKLQQTVQLIFHTSMAEHQSDAKFTNVCRKSDFSNRISFD